MTPKQAKWYGEYIKHSNATLASRVACGLSGAAAEVDGVRMLRNAKVAAAIEAWRTRQLEKFEVKAERTLRKLAEMAYGDIGEMLDEDGNLLPVDRMSEAARTMIAGLDVETTEGPGRVTVRTQKVKLADRIRALELLGKYQKLFTDKIEHSGTMTLEQLVTQARKSDKAAA